MQAVLDYLTESKTLHLKVLHLSRLLSGGEDSPCQHHACWLALARCICEQAQQEGLGGGQLYCPPPSRGCGCLWPQGRACSHSAEGLHVGYALRALIFHLIMRIAMSLLLRPRLNHGLLL